MKTILVFSLALAAFPLASAAQTSASYKLEESTFNAGGNPAPVLTSPSYKVTLDAVGDGVSATGLSSASYRSDAGFTPDYRPPGEVAGQRFTSKTTQVWEPDPSIGKYDVYRGLVSGLPGSFGTCLVSGGVTAESVTDTENPAAGQCFFYLVTAENRLQEEGTKGYTSSGGERGNAAPCP
jgi:hypothetical protein